MLLKLHQNSEISNLVTETLTEICQKFPDAGLLHLTLAELSQKDGQPEQMAASMLAAAKVDRSLLPQVTNRLNELLKEESNCQ